MSDRSEETLGHCGKTKKLKKQDRQTIDIQRTKQEEEENRQYFDASSRSVEEMDEMPRQASHQDEMMRVQKKKSKNLKKLSSEKTDNYPDPSSRNVEEMDEMPRESSHHDEMAREQAEKDKSSKVTSSKKSDADEVFDTKPLSTATLSSSTAFREGLQHKLVPEEKKLKEMGKGGVEKTPKPIIEKDYVDYVGYEYREHGSVVFEDGIIHETYSQTFKPGRIEEESEPNSRSRDEEKKDTHRESVSGEKQYPQKKTDSHHKVR